MRRRSPVRADNRARVRLREPRNARAKLPLATNQDFSLCWRRGRGEGWHARGEAVEPGDEARMIVPPFSFETEIAIAECASERDLSYIRRRRERRRGGLEGGERAVDLAGLMIEPFRLLPLRPAEAGLPDQHDRGIHQPVGQRPQAPGGEPAPASPPTEPPPPPPLP